MIERIYIFEPDETEITPRMAMKYLEEGSVNNKTSEGSYQFSKNLKKAKSDFEKRFLVEQLTKNNWNITKTAEEIGVERSNLHKKIKQFKIDGSK